VERCSAWAELGPTNPYGVKGLGVHDVEVIASVHQYFGEPCVADDRVNNKRVLARLWDMIWVVVAIKCDGRPRPVKEGWHGWLSGVDLSTLHLALAPRVIGRGTAEDHEIVIDDEKVIVLLLAIALVRLGPLVGVALPLGTSEEVAFHHVAFLEGVVDRAPVVRAWLLEYLIKNSRASLGRGSGVLALGGSDKGVLA
jgi:hypothetical protein